MRNKFFFFFCRGHLNVDENVIFSAKKKDGTKGLILVHSQLGNYDVIHNPDFAFDEGEKLEFYCSICHARLTSAKHENLCNIKMIDATDQKEYEIIFSMLAGEKCTYKVLADVVETFGEDGQTYSTFFYMSQIK